MCDDPDCPACTIHRAVKQLRKDGMPFPVAIQFLFGCASVEYGEDVELHLVEAPDTPPTPDKANGTIH